MSPLNLKASCKTILVLWKCYFVNNTLNNKWKKVDQKWLSIIAPKTDDDNKICPCLLEKDGQNNSSV